MGENNDLGKRKEDELTTQQLGIQASSDNNNNTRKDTLKKQHHDSHNTSDNASEQDSRQPLLAQYRRNFQQLEHVDQTTCIQHKENVCYALEQDSRQLLPTQDRSNMQQSEHVDQTASMHYEVNVCFHSANVGVKIGNMVTSVRTIALHGWRLDLNYDGFLPVLQQRVLEKSKQQAHSSPNGIFGNSGISTANRFDTLEGLQQEEQWVPQDANSSQGKKSSTKNQKGKGVESYKEKIEDKMEADMEKLKLQKQNEGQKETTYTSSSPWSLKLRDGIREWKKRMMSMIRWKVAEICHMLQLW